MNGSTIKRQPPDSWVRNLILAAAFCLSAGPLHAALLPGKSKLSLEVFPGDGEVVYLRDGPLKESISNSRVTPGGDGSAWAGVSAGETGSKDDRRFSSARATSVSLGVNNSNAPTNAPGKALTESRLEYQLMIVQVAPPPVPLAGFPAKVNLRVDAFASASGDEANNAGYASAQAYVAHNVGVAAEAFSRNGPDANTVIDDFELFVIPGQLFDVRLYSFVSVFSGLALGGPASGTGIAFARADPVFSFNQTAFEEMALAQGFAPFALSSYFAFQESPFAVPIPEPSSALLMLAGTVLVAGAYRRRRSQAGGRTGMMPNSVSSNCARH